MRGPFATLPATCWALAIIVLPGCEQRSTPSLYDDLVTVCPQYIDDLQAAYQAAQRDGWVLVSTDRGNDRHPEAIQMVAKYTFVKKAEKRMMGLTQIVIFSKGHPNLIENQCMIAHQTDPASIAKLRKWANVPADHDDKLNQDIYWFLDENGLHHPITANYFLMVRKGERRGLGISQDYRGFSSATLMAALN